MLDPAPARELPSGMLKNIGWFTPNQTEAAFFAENNGHHAEAGPRALADELLAKGIQRVVLKLGSDGALICCNGSTARISSFAVNAVDTTAAGDAFNGGFAVGLMRGMTSEESGRFAAAVAAISVTRPGARDSMPSLDEVESFLAEHKSRGENAQIH